MWCVSGEAELRSFLAVALAKRKLAEEAAAAAATSESEAKEPEELERAAITTKAANEEVSNASYEVLAATHALHEVVRNIFEAAREKAGAASLDLSRLMVCGAPASYTDPATKVAVDTQLKALARGEVLLSLIEMEEEAFSYYMSATAKAPATRLHFYEDFKRAYPQMYQEMTKQGFALKGVASSLAPAMYFIGRRLSTETILLTAEAMQRQMTMQHPNPLTVLQVYEILCANLARNPHTTKDSNTIFYPSKAAILDQLDKAPTDPNRVFPSDESLLDLYCSNPNAMAEYEYPRYVLYGVEGGQPRVLVPHSLGGDTLLGADRQGETPQGTKLGGDPPQGTKLGGDPPQGEPVHSPQQNTFSLFQWFKRFLVTQAVGYITTKAKECEKYGGETPEPLKEWVDLHQ